MFKIESYITPILLSYVNRYIKNFKLEDSQVSLWGGAASFNNLELNLNVLEQELQLPFSFVSGSIRELIIHVPWTRITWEPITITINTIECILNLKGKDNIPRTSDVTGSSRKSGGGKVVEAPPGYIQSLINKIVSNISIHCNNLILKYVEEDIVLSMNVKHLKFESANEKWEPAYTAQVILRKVITVNDLTLCLDKRNASGKIEVYQEPMLYKCSMTMHLLRLYHSATASRASTTRLDVYCNNMEFSMTEQQVPMLLRLMTLLYALQQKQLKPPTEKSKESAATSEQKELYEKNETWSGWAWSKVSSVLPAPWEEEWNTEQMRNFSGHTLHIGSYVDKMSVTFKVLESSTERGYYSQKKLRYWPMLTLQLQGIYCDTVIHGLKWFNVTGGISQASLIPVGNCSCSQAEVSDSDSPVPYLKMGSSSNYYKTDSLFDAEAIENRGKKREYTASWDNHMSIFTESVLLERTPAFAFDYLYQLEMPSDMTSDILSDLGSSYEFSNLAEVSSTRLCIGPFKLRLCSGLIHRTSSLQVAAASCEYAPYYISKPDPSLQELLPASEEDFDALSEFIPKRTMRVTFFAPIVEIELLNHPYFVPTKGHLFKKVKKLSSSNLLSSAQDSNLPKLTIECQLVDITTQNPMYPNRLVYTTCKLPDPPKALFDACYAKMDVKILGVVSKLMLNSMKQSIILSPSSVSFSSRSILKPQYWVDSNIPHEEITLESEIVTVNGTKAKLLVISNIIEKFMLTEPEPSWKNIYSSTLLVDASKDYGFPHMEFCLEGIRFRKVTTNSTVTIDTSLGSIQAFIFEPLDVKSNLDKFSPKRSVTKRSMSKNIQQILFISGPEPKPVEKTKSLKQKSNIPDDTPLFTATLQYPLSPDLQKHPPILIFNLQEIRICVDPLLCKFLLYVPKKYVSRFDSLDGSSLNPLMKNMSEASGPSTSETPRKLSSQIGSVHSSSDRDHVSMPPKVHIASKEEVVDVQEKVYNFLKRWFDVWKGMMLCGDISQCTVYFPLVSLSAVGSQGIQEAVEQAVNKDNPPNIMVIALPFANIRSAQRQSVSKYLRVLPVTFPDNIWSADKSSFPWTMSISELSCYTIQFGNKLICLKPVSLSATVGLSTRPSKTPSASSDAIGSTSGSIKSDIGYLGVCIHIDMTPILITTSEIQVYLFANVLYGLIEVAQNLKPEKRKRSPKIPEAPAPLITKGSSTMSPSNLLETTLDSASEGTPPIGGSLQSDSLEGDSVKLTAWVQWTITRFTIELLSNEHQGSTPDDVGSLQPRLKLVVDAEDIVSSLDFQSVYLKIKSKIGSASIQHYKRNSPTSTWEPGAFSGVVMRLRDDIPTSQRQEDNGFVSVTITRASCQHTHTLWGALQSKRKDKKADVPSQFLSKTRYITETVINVQPVDFIVSFHTLRSFYLVVVPLLSIQGAKKIPLESESSVSLINTISNQTLPLAYFECQDIRLIMPSSEGDDIQDVVILQVQKISLSPTPVNPICRTPLRADIYEQAAHARILNVPGSEVEDRQYQLDLIGISLSTSAWKDVASIFSTGPVLSNLRGVSENPAVEWNNLEQGQPNMTPSLNLWQVTDKFDITVIAAPAMIYKDTTIVCGHSVEVNFVSDIFLNVSLRQIRLVSSLICELIELIAPPSVEEDLTGRSDLKFPYSYLDLNNYSRVDEEADAAATLPADPLADSGIETSDIKSLLSIRAQEATSKTLVAESDKFLFSSRSSHPMHFVTPQTSVLPLDVLFTAGKIGLTLCQDCDYKKSSATKMKNRRKKTSRMQDEDEDHGYDAGEESVDEKFDNYKRYIPLLYISVHQPNVFLSKQQIGRKMQISCFDLNLKVGSTEYSPISNVPTVDDFPFHLLRTRSGAPDSSTGVIPAFFTMKYTKGVSKTAQLDIKLSKPTMILCKASYWSHLLTIKDKVIENFSGALQSIAAFSDCSTASFCVVTTQAVHLGRKASSSSSYVKPIRPSVTYQRYQDIKQTLAGITVVNFASDQIIFVFKAENGPELHVGLQHLKDTLTVYNRPEKLCNKITLECISCTVDEETDKKVLLNPWMVTVEFCFFWESWQTPESDPQISVTLESDCIIVDVTSDQVECLEAVLKDWTEFIGAGQTELGGRTSVLGTLEPPKLKTSEKDQHYKDDLRAGAFQFVDATTNNTDELPLPYQVMFWNTNISAMAWKYPQPRALTKVRVFPVPYKVALNTEDNLLVLCHLEYWSECRNCYMPYTQFYLSESEVCHLSLPQNCPKTVVASTWRVVITTVYDNDDLSYVNNDVSISPRALAACMRIDSYFNKSLVPNLNVSLYVTKVEVSLYTYFNKTATMKLPEFLKHYTSDLLFPENQKFLTLSLDNLTGYFTTWNFEVMATETSASVRCNVTDYAFLTEQSLVDPFTCKLQVCFADQLTCNFISKPIQLRFGPTIAHTLAVSTQLWSQSDQNETDFVIMTRYVVCNDTNMKIRFSQTGTDEDILLGPRQFHLYSWRSQRKRQQLKVALEMTNWTWSKSFTVFREGTQSIYFGPEKINTLFITVKNLSATQKQIIVSGQLVISNMLSEHFEMKIVEAVTENKDVELKNAPIHVIPAKKATPSIFIENKKKYYLRLRFYGLEAAWTGDIPLREHASGSQPWLVKVPLQERGQFLSIWCRIVTQDIRKGTRILAVLWPLFMIKSNLPVSAKVHIETPTLNVHLDSVVNGRGEMQQLYCPGTIDHSHQLTFHLDNANINVNANPYVPLNYSLVDHQKFFKKANKVDIDEILDVLKNYSEPKWPYFGDDLDNIEWIVDNQPLTHVQVRYQNACQYSCALLVELLPWCLMVNTLGTLVSVVLNGVELCRLQHHGIVAPPKLEENFHLGVYTGGIWAFSGPLQLAKSDWSQSFYMPKITGTIPLEGTVKTVVKNDDHVAMVSIASIISNEIRLLKVTSSHVLSNHMAMQMQVACLAVPDVGKVFELPTYIDKFAFTIAPHMQNSHSGIPIIQWNTVTPPCDVSMEYALYMLFCVRPEFGWSCPIRVDKVLLNKAFCVMSDGIPVPVVLTGQESNGQIFLAIHNNPRPQLYIENQTQVPIYCGQSLLDDHKAAKECEHFRWNCRVVSLSSVYYAMPILAEKFPELPQINYPERICLATFAEEGTNEFQWSSGISVANNNDLFAIIPYFGDVKLTIVNTACTTYITISSVSELEISAKDIRVRLSMQEEPTQKVYLANKNLDTFVKGTNLAYDTKANLPLSSDSSSFSFDSCLSACIVPSKVKSLLVNTIPMRKDWKRITFNAFVKSFEISLISDYDSAGEEKWELANFACEDIVVHIVQEEQMKIRVSATDVQIDNQLYARESYDFPVVLVGEDRKPIKKQNILSIPIDSLTENATETALVVVDVMLETWIDQSVGKNITGIKVLKIKLNPLSCFIEDIYITRLMDYLKVFIPNTLVVWPDLTSKTKYIPAIPGSVYVPEVISWECAILARPLTIRYFCISPLAVLLSVHSSMKLYIALDQSPLQFSKFERRRIFTTPYRLGHSLTMHYLSGAIFGAGWVVSSLELLGSPGGLARAMGEGLRDFVSLPYRGLVQGPMAFLKGITNGSASLMKHITAGTLQSVTKLASSVARNLDRLTLDEEHVKRTEEQRKTRPQGVAQGFIQGLTGLGVSLLGAVGGIAHHPLQCVLSDKASPRSLAAGVGLGIVGVFTKPLSGAAELVALTGQGLLQGAGWNSLPATRSKPQVYRVLLASNSSLKYTWKLMNALSNNRLLYVTEATRVTATSDYDAVALILTTEVLVIVNIDEDETVKVIGVNEINAAHNSDPTLLSLKLMPSPVPPVEKVEDELVVEMDPANRARVADYVRSTAGLLNLPETTSEHSDISISPLSSPGMSPNPQQAQEFTVLQYYVSPQSRAYFLRLLALAKQQSQTYSFPVL